MNPFSALKNLSMCNHSIKVTLQEATVMKITALSQTPHSLHHTPGDWGIMLPLFYM
jgi:hypothetical protein